MKFVPDILFAAGALCICAAAFVLATWLGLFAVGASLCALGVYYSPAQPKSAPKDDPPR